MKNLVLFIALLLFTFHHVNGQEDDSSTSTTQGKWLIEANTGFGGGIMGLVGHSANTGFGLSSVDGETIWSIGAEAGYFIVDDLAIKFGLGYSDLAGESMTSYKLGVKYYLTGVIPFQVDITGASWEGSDENPLWLGLQGGYAWFITEHVSIEPGLRYNVSLNEDFSDEGIFEFRIGFALYF
ncbi:hypothetical protein [Aestuariivivens sediminicola]|uniref:hypothetical protein n=1 Tax=Aestuariivivens sediminicola TaxID=2913560 RepID=UPI001F563A0E|nr:hypothetical protein [Aestuariivivens sediminicola]